VTKRYVILHHETGTFGVAQSLRAVADAFPNMDRETVCWALAHHGQCDDGRTTVIPFDDGYHMIDRPFDSPSPTLPDSPHDGWRDDRDIPLLEDRVYQTVTLAPLPGRVLIAILLRVVARVIMLDYGANQRNDGPVS